MQALHELKDMLMDELSSLTSKGELTAGSLDTVDKLTHSIKSIDTIMAMEDAGYSYEGHYDGMGMSYADRNRDSRGRYSRTGSRYSRRGYSRADKKDLVEELRELMNEASDSRSKVAIQNAIRDMEE